MRFVYDLQGREAARLADGSFTPGYYHVIWNVRNQDGGEIPSGIYITRLFIPPTLGVPATGSPAGLTPEHSK